MIAPPPTVTLGLRVIAGALLVEFVSVCIPGWLIVNFEDNHIKVVRNYAVWFMTECITNKDGIPFFDNKECRSGPYHEMLQAKMTKLEDLSEYEYSIGITIWWEVLSTLGVLCLVFTLLFLFKIRKNNLAAFRNPNIVELSPLIFATPAIFMTASVVLFSVCFHLSTNVHSRHRGSAPYGLIIAAFGTMMTCIGIVVNVFMFLKRRQTLGTGETLDAVDGQTDEAVPMTKPITSQSDHALAAPPPSYEDALESKNTAPPHSDHVA